MSERTPLGRAGLVGWIVLVTAICVGVVAGSRRPASGDAPLPWWGLPSAGTVHAALGAVLGRRAGTRLRTVAALWGTHLALGGLAAAAIVVLEPMGLLEALGHALLVAPGAAIAQTLGAALIVLPIRGGSGPEGNGDGAGRAAGAVAPFAVAAPGPAAPAPPADGLRVSFHRVAGQIPAVAFSAPIETVGARLAVPGVIVVPREAALQHLGEGFAVVEWTRVADQFPAAVFAVPRAAVGEAIPRGRLLLPLDEIVGQLPLSLFTDALPALDLAGLEEFPAPFPEDGAEPAPAAASAAAGAIAFDGQRPAPRPVAPVAPPGPLATVDGEGADSGPDLLAEALAPAPRPSPPPAASGLAPAVAAEAPAIAAPRPAVIVNAAETAALAADLLAAPAVPVAPLEGRVVAGVGVHLLAAPATPAAEVVAALEAVLPLLDERRCPWALEQLTLHAAERAIVVTPLGLLATGGPILVVAGPARGALALTQLRTRRAAAAWRARHGATEEPPRGDPGRPGGLAPLATDADVAPLAGRLSAFGPVEAASFRDGALDVHCFTPRGVSADRLAALAASLGRALAGSGAGPGAGAIEAVTLAVAGLRAVIQRVDGKGGREELLVAAGAGTPPAGRARRQATQTAAALAAARA